MTRDRLKVVGLQFAISDSAEHQANFATVRHSTIVAAQTK
jgi:hypothetical protein